MDTGNTTDCYNTVGRIFIHLRDTYPLLSRQDIEIIHNWKMKKIPSALIIRIMQDVALSCQEQKKPFPKTCQALNSIMDMYLHKNTIHQNNLIHREKPHQ